MEKDKRFHIDKCSAQADNELNRLHVVSDAHKLRLAVLDQVRHVLQPELDDRRRLARVSLALGSGGFGELADARLWAFAQGDTFT